MPVLTFKNKHFQSTTFNNETFMFKHYTTTAMVYEST